MAKYIFFNIGAIFAQCKHSYVFKYIVAKTIHDYYFALGCHLTALLEIVLKKTVRKNKCDRKRKERKKRKFLRLMT